MTVTDKLTKALAIAKPLIETIIDMIGQGISDEEIRKRIAEPGGVGEKLIADLRARQSKIDSFINDG